MKVLKLVLLALALTMPVIGGAVAHAYGYHCQYDKCSLYFTGQTKTEYGKLAKLYKCGCNASHQYWIVD